MAYGGKDSARLTRLTTKNTEVPVSLAGWIATAGEIIGILNKNSAKAPAAPGDVADVQPISSNTLNVTRVGGVTTLISAAGGAALVLFNVNKTKDRAPIVVAAYLSVGLIVAAALLTVAIIIAADVRARTAVATAVSPTVQPRRENVRQVKAEVAAGAPGYIVALERAYDYVLVDAAAASTVLMLPSAASARWQQMTIMRQDRADTTVTIRPQDRETIEDQHERYVDGEQSAPIYSDGTNWLAIR